MMKLQSFNARVDPSLQLSFREEEDLKDLVSYLAQEPEYSCDVAPGAYSLLDRIVTSWPPIYIYPAVDLLRILILWLEASLRYSSPPGINIIHGLLDIAMHGYTDKETGEKLSCPTALRLMVLRLVNNMFATDESYKAVLSPTMGPIVIQLAVDYIACADLETTKACATILFNASSKLGHVGRTMPDCVGQCVGALIYTIPLTENMDAVFRLLMALGRILWHDPIAVELVKLSDFNVDKHLNLDDHAEHVKLVAHEIAAIIAK